MLVLTRRRDESIVIGEGEKAITITVLKVSGGQVRIGLEGHKDIQIVRSEVLEREKDECQRSRKS